MDKGLLDRDDLRCGKVDDLILELPDDDPSRPPQLVALLTGPLAYAHTAGNTATRIARLIYRMLGVADPHPVEVPWAHVRQVDVMVRLDIDRDHINTLGNAVRDRLFTHLPGA
jgi:hypothetical protein